MPDALHAATQAEDDASLTLPAWIYDDPEFLALERARLFMCSWQVVCHVSDLAAAGDYATLELLGELVFVVRDESGAIRAFHNVCRHRAARLLDGDIGNCGRRITCPYHAWTYALDGRLGGVPFRSEYTKLGSARDGLVPVECETAFGLVFVRLEAGGTSLAEMLAPAAADLSLYRLEELQPLRRLSHAVLETNWKNAVDNYIDALHVRVAHRGLDSLVGDSYGLTVQDGACRLWGSIACRADAAWSARAYARVLPPIDYLPEPNRRTWLYYQIWPNLCFNLYPDMVEFMHFVPVAPGRTLLRDASYALPDDRRALRLARALNLRINRRVGREDQDLVERVQAGMRSRSYTQGPLGRNEVCLRHFAARLRSELPVCRLPVAPRPGRIAEVNEEMRSTRSASDS